MSGWGMCVGGGVRREWCEWVVRGWCGVECAGVFTEHYKHCLHMSITPIHSHNVTHNVDTKNTAFSVRDSRPSNLLVPTLRAFSVRNSRPSNLLVPLLFSFFFLRAQKKSVCTGVCEYGVCLNNTMKPIHAYTVEPRGGSRGDFEGLKPPLLKKLPCVVV